MISLWHTIWPGWSALAAQVFIGILTMPIMVAVQLLLMSLLKRWNHKHIAAEVDRQFAQRLEPFLARITQVEAANRELTRQLNGQRFERRGW